MVKRKRSSNEGGKGKGNARKKRGTTITTTVTTSNQPISTSPDYIPTRNENNAESNVASNATTTTTAICHNATAAYDADAAAVPGTQHPSFNLQQGTWLIWMSYSTLPSGSYGY